MRQDPILLFVTRLLPDFQLKLPMLALSGLIKPNQINNDFYDELYHDMKLIEGIVWVKINLQTN